MASDIKMPEGLVFGAVQEALRLGMYYMASAEQHFRDSSLDAYSRQIASNLESVRMIQAHALQILNNHAEARSKEAAQRPTGHED